MLPKRPVLLDPLHGIAHWPGDEPAAPHASFAPPHDEPCPLEHGEVFGDRRERHVERRRQLAECRLASGQPRHDGPPRRIGQRGEDGIQRARGMVNHMV